MNAEKERKLQLEQARKELNHMHNTMLLMLFGKETPAEDTVVNAVRRVNEQLKAQQYNQMKAEVKELNSLNMQRL